MEYVYVLAEEGSWDYYPQDISLQVFSSFAAALAEFNQRVAYAKVDLDGWNESGIKIEEELNVNEADESASFQAYEEGYYTRLHSNIVITKEKVK